MCQSHNWPIALTLFLLPKALMPADQNDVLVPKLFPDVARED